MHDSAEMSGGPSALGGNRVADLVNTIRVTAEAADGHVRIELDGRNDITALTLDPKVKRLPADEIADAIKEAYATARAQVQEEIARTPLETAMGPEDAARAREALDRVEERLAASRERTEMLLDRLRRME